MRVNECVWVWRPLEGSVIPCSYSCCNKTEHQERAVKSRIKIKCKMVRNGLISGLKKQHVSAAYCIESCSYRSWTLVNGDIKYWIEERKLRGLDWFEYFRYCWKATACSNNHSLQTWWAEKHVRIHDTLNLEKNTPGSIAVSKHGVAEAVHVKIRQCSCIYLFIFLCILNTFIVNTGTTSTTPSTILKPDVLTNQLSIVNNAIDDAMWKWNRQTSYIMVSSTCRMNTIQNVLQEIYCHTNTTAGCWLEEQIVLQPTPLSPTYST